MIADGLQATVITVIAVDEAGAPLPGRAVQLSATGSGNHWIQPAGPTDVQGRATGTLASVVAEPKTVSVVVDPGPDQVLLVEQPTVVFVGDPTTVSATLSSADASPAGGVIANGVAATTIVVSIRDANGNPVGGQIVQLLATGSGNVLVQPVGATDASGQAAGYLSSTVAEVKTLTAVVDPGPSEVVLAAQPSVSFVADRNTVSASLSNVLASPTASVIADGASISTITVTVRDANGNAVPGRTVEISSTGSGNTVVQPAGPTDASGVTTGTLASVIAETKSITALVDPGPSQVTLAEQPTVGFVPDPSAVSSLLSSAVASPASDVVADGVATSVITVVVRNAYGVPLDGRLVQISVTGAGNTLSQPPAATDSVGMATAAFASTVAETKTVAVVVDPASSGVVLDEQPTVVFVGDPSTISPTLSTIVAAPSSHVLANGADASTLTVTVRDANGNAVSGRVVEVSATGSGNAITQPHGATDASGVATATLSTTCAELKIISAAVDPSSSAVTMAARPIVEFAWGSDNTRYVKQSGFDPRDCSGGTSPSTAWRSLAKAAVCAGPGTTVYVGSGTYSGSVLLARSGTSAAPIRFVADVDGTHTGDAGPVVVDAVGASAGCLVDGASFVILEGFTITGAAGAGIRVGDTPSSSVILRGNVVYGNGIGIRVKRAAGAIIEHNVVSWNAIPPGDGILVLDSDSVAVRDNLVYANGRHGIRVEASSLGLLLQSNTLYANAGDQIYLDGSGNAAVARDNVIAFGAACGLRVDAGSTLASDHNDVWANGALDWDGVVPGAGDLSLDPLLVDPAGADGILGGAHGADDRFQLDSLAPSPAIDAGSADAETVPTSEGGSLADRTTRVDAGPDGAPPDGAPLNQGYHGAIAWSALPPLEAGDLRVAWGEGTARSTRLLEFDVSEEAWGGEISAPTTRSPQRWIVHALSPLASSEEMLATMSGGGSGAGSGAFLQLLRWSGASWSKELSTSAGTDPTKRGFDLTFEQASGDVLLVWTDATSTPRFSARTLGTWSAPAPLPLNDGAGPWPDTNTGVVQWIELEERPGTNEIALAFSDARRSLVAIVWDGSQWSTASAVRLSNGLGAHVSTTEVRNRAFDLAYESSSGRLLAAWARDGATGFRYAIRPPGGVFGAGINVTAALGGEPNFVELASEPGTNRIALGLSNLEDVAAVERFGAATWTGVAWAHAGQLDSLTVALASTGSGDFPVGVAWTGTDGTAVCVYPDQQSGQIDWARWTSGSGWVVQADVPVAGKGTTDSVRLVHDSTRTAIDAVLSDDGGKLFAARFDGGAWTVAGAPLETNLASTSSMPFGASRKRP